jgi:hypothetical protein
MSSTGANTFTLATSHYEFTPAHPIGALAKAEKSKQVVKDLVDGRDVQN